MSRLWRQPWKPPVVVGAVAGFAVAAAMMYIAWQHNPQGEFHDETGVHWFSWFRIGISWLLAVAPPAALVVAVISVIARRVLRDA
jgi:phosphate/sulfate permease